MKNNRDPVNQEHIVLTCQGKDNVLFFQLSSPSSVECTPLLVAGGTGKREHFPVFYFEGYVIPTSPISCYK